MAHTDVAASATRSPWDQCDHCQAPLDSRQRYCVACGARRPQADDPVASYFVASARRARATAPAAGPAHAQRPQSGFRTALILALIPLAAAIGVVVGRDGSDGNDQLIEALKAQKAPVVNVGSGGGGGAAAADASTGDRDKAKKDKDSGNGGADAADGEVISQTRYGSARKLTDNKITPQQVQESKKALEHIVESKGKEYVEQQRNLPDQIVIP
jgi:hypothetical protein